MFFGPGRTDFAVYELDNPAGDACLLQGDYRYNEKEETIIFTIVENQIGFNEGEIVLHKE